MEGQIKEKEKAKDVYDDAIAGGHGAYLLEEKTDTVWCLCVNINVCMRLC